jgi:hypothetical protein
MSDEATSVRYVAYDVTGPEDVVIAQRLTYPQAIEAAFRYVALHPELVNVWVFKVEGTTSTIVWNYDGDKPEYQNRVRMASEAIARNEPENLLTGLP